MQLPTDMIFDDICGSCFIPLALTATGDPGIAGGSYFGHLEGEDWWGHFFECSLWAANTKWLKAGVSQVFIQVILMFFAYLQLQLAWFLNPVVNRCIKLIHQLHWREGDQSTYVKKSLNKGGHTGIPWLAFIWEVENPIFGMLTTDHVLASK